MGCRAGWLAIFAFALACGQTARNRQPSGNPEPGSAGEGSSGGESSGKAGTTSRAPEMGGAEIGLGGAAAGGDGAGERGEGGEPAAIDCEGLHVPEDFAELVDAVAAAPDGGTVCLAPGLYTANLELPRSVGLQGSPGTVLCGDLSLSGEFAPVNAIEPLKQRLSELVVFGRATGEETLDLDLERVRFLHEAKAAADAGCPTPASPEGLKLNVDPGLGPQRLLIEDCELPAGGVHVEFAGGYRTDLEVTMRRSICRAPQCWDLLRVWSAGGPLSGSRLRVLAENNISQNSVLEAFSFYVDSMSSIDTADSAIVLRNNTIYSPGDANYGAIFSINQAPLLRVVVANNAIGNLGSPIHSNQAVETSHNLLAKPEDAVDAATWYVDAQNGDFTPAADSPLRNAADEMWLPADDYFGNPRTTADIGAIAAP